LQIDSSRSTADRQQIEELVPLFLLTFNIELTSEMVRYLRNCRILVSKYLKPRGSPVKVDKGLFLIF
jgi:hypothetical protein